MKADILATQAVYRAAVAKLDAAIASDNHTAAESLARVVADLALAIETALRAHAEYKLEPWETT